MAEDLDDHRRIFDACPERAEGAAMIFKALPSSPDLSNYSIHPPSSAQGVMLGVRPQASLPLNGLSPSIIVQAASTHLTIEALVSRAAFEFW